MNIHDIDLVRWFSGHDPVRVWALANNIAAPELKDLGECETGVAQLEMDNGSISTLLGGDVMLLTDIKLNWKSWEPMVGFE